MLSSKVRRNVGASFREETAKAKVRIRFQTRTPVQAKVLPVAIRRSETTNVLMTTGIVQGIQGADLIIQ